MRMTIMCPLMKLIRVNSRHHRQTKDVVSRSQSGELNRFLRIFENANNNFIMSVILISECGQIKINRKLIKINKLTNGFSFFACCYKRFITSSYIYIREIYTVLIYLPLIGVLSRICLRKVKNLNQKVKF
jgi:ssRNA-specific RNase YbeY (16S rRNA maturation enzyme)